MQPKALADLLALTGTLELRHPMAPEVKLTVLAHPHASGKAITFAAYAEVDGEDEDEDECRVADLTGLTPDCELHTAVAMLESVRGACSSWPTLTESLA